MIYKKHTENLEQSLGLIKVQYTQLVEEKQELVKGLKERVNQVDRLE